MYWFCVKNLCTKYCCKSLNKQSSGVQERINPFYVNSYGENSFGLRTFRFTNDLQERMKFVNRGLTVVSIRKPCATYSILNCVEEIAQFQNNEEFVAKLNFPLTNIYGPTNTLKNKVFFFKKPNKEWRKNSWSLRRKKHF